MTWSHPVTSRYRAQTKFMKLKVKTIMQDPVIGESLEFSDQQCAMTGKIPHMDPSNSVHSGKFKLWCSSLSHHHFCASFLPHSKISRFYIPLRKTLLLVCRKDPSEGFLITSKLSKIRCQSKANLVGGYVPLHQEALEAELSIVRP